MAMPDEFNLPFGYGTQDFYGSMPDLTGAAGTFLNTSYAQPTSNFLGFDTAVLNPATNQELTQAYANLGSSAPIQKSTVAPEQSFLDNMSTMDIVNSIAAFGNLGMGLYGLNQAGKQADRSYRLARDEFGLSKDKYNYAVGEDYRKSSFFNPAGAGAPPKEYA